MTDVIGLLGGRAAYRPTIYSIMGRNHLCFVFSNDYKATIVSADALYLVRKFIFLLNLYSICRQPVLQVVASKDPICCLLKQWKATKTSNVFKTRFHYETTNYIVYCLCAIPLLLNSLARTTVHISAEII